MVFSYCSIKVGRHGFQIASGIKGARNDVYE